MYFRLRYDKIVWGDVWYRVYRHLRSDGSEYVPKIVVGRHVVGPSDFHMRIGDPIEDDAPEQPLKSLKRKHVD